MLRKESNSGALTRHSAQPDELTQALETGNLPKVDTHPPFRELLQHKAFTVRWVLKYISNAAAAIAMLGVDVPSEIYRLFYYQGIWW